MRRMALSFSFLIHLVLKEVFLNFILCFPFNKPMLNANLEMFITCKYTVPQECKNNILCKGRKKTCRQKLVSLKRGGMVFDSDTKYFSWLRVWFVSFLGLMVATASPYIGRVAKMFSKMYNVTWDELFLLHFS